MVFTSDLRILKDLRVSRFFVADGSSRHLAFRRAFTARRNGRQNGGHPDLHKRAQLCTDWLAEFD
jgi:hypothetical protein